MRRSLSWHSIQVKLTVTFLLILLPLVGISLFANYNSQNIIYEQITDRTRGALRTALEYVDQFTKNMDQQTLLISSNPNLIDIWKETSNPLSKENLYDIHKIQQQLTAFINVNEAVEEAFIIHGASGTGVSTEKGGINWPEVREEKWFRQTIEASGGLVVHIPHSESLDTAAYLQENYIYYARLLDVFSSNQEPNVMVLAVKKASLLKIIQHLQTSPNIAFTLSYMDSYVLGSHPASATRERLFSIKEDTGTWSILMEQPEAELFAQPRQFQRLTVLIIGISILLAFWIAWLVYTEIAKPLRKMSAAFSLFSGGKLTTTIEHKRKDEFGHLMNAFNRMAAAQRKLIEDDYEKELRLAHSEFSLLQSQINPHFLYNTLDSIYSVAIKNHIQEISEMVINLAQFFRFSLGKGRDSFTLEETIEHLMYYVRVQQIRTDQFTVEIDLAEETKRISILKLILQPIVENAIVHGLGKSVYGGELFIRTKLVNQFLHIEVEDTGIGIKEQELKEIQQTLSEITSKSYQKYEQKPFSHHFGLKNVKSRIKLYYGEAANLIIDSVYEEGTKITLIIPQQEETL